MTGRVLGTLAGRRARVELDVDDALWTARALYGEAPAGGDGRKAERYAVVSCWLRRWAVYSDKRLRDGLEPLWPTFRALVTAHSQPVNPRWADDPDTPEVDGDLARRNPSRATPAQLARRARIAGMPWDQIPTPVRSVVLELLTGSHALTAKPADDFAAPVLWQRYGADWSSREARLRTLPGAVERKDAGDRYVDVPGADRGANVLVSSPLSRSSAEPRVIPAGPIEVSGALALAAVGAALAVAA